MKSSIFSSFLIAFCFFAFSANAQIPVSIGGLELTASTENPSPGQRVTITARSYTLDINSSKVTWIVDGATVKSATGATVLEVTAPNIGKVLSIKVSAMTPEGRSETATMNLGSGSVDMIFETDGYVHPFFKGKITPVYQNAIKIIAVPHLANSSGAEYDPKTLIYQWKKNDRAIENQSGYGKQSITLVGDIVPRPYDLTVDVSSRDSLVSTRGRVSVSAGTPSISFYVDDPLYGTLFNKAINSVLRIGSQKETSVLAVPFGFNASRDGNDGLSWSWAINGIRRTELSTSQSVVLRAPDGASGSSNVLLEIRNTDKILQGVSGGFSASFSASKPVETEQLTF